MKVRIYSQEKDVPIVNSTVKGKALVKPSDNVGFNTYEIRIKAGEILNLKPYFGDNVNHIYYCVFGEGDAACSNGSTFKLSPQSLLALSSTTTAVLSAKTSIRIVAIYVEAAEPPPIPAKFVPISDIIGTERDIDWSNGHSRRYLRRDDGFGLSVHNTFGDPLKDSPLQYKNNHELAYYVRGDVQYEWNDGKSTAALNIGSVREDKDGIAFLMDEKDAHVMKSGQGGCECLCVFNPPLTGTERHDFSSGFSSY